MKIDRDKLAQKAYALRTGEGIRLEAMGCGYEIKLLDTTVSSLLKQIETGMETLQARIEKSASDIEPATEVRNG